MKRALALIVVCSAARLMGQPQAPPRDPTAPTTTQTLTGTIRGRVVAAASGDPLRNASVKIGENVGVPSVLTDADGRFALTHVPAGDHAVLAMKTGYATAAYGGELPTPVTVAPGATVDDIGIRLPKGAVISGRVLDDLGAPVSLMSVVAQRADARVSGEQTGFETDDTGAYRLFGLPAGEYVVATAGGRLIMNTVPMPSEFPAGGVYQYYPNRTTRERAKLLALGPGNEAAGIDFTVPLPPPPPPAPLRSAASGAIRGRVVRADGIPLRRARVQLLSSENQFAPLNAPTDDDGRYEFRNLPPGTYLIGTAALGTQPVRLGQSRASDRGTLITLARGAALDGIDLTLPRPSAISGRITDEFGDPIANANVRVEKILFSKGRRRLMSVAGIATRQADDQGRYRIFGLQPGRYVIGAVVGQPVPGWETADMPGYARTYYPGTPIPAEAETIELNGGDDALNVDVALVRGRIGRVTGTVYDAAGVPLDGIVFLMPSYRSGAVASPPLRVRTTPDGAFEFSDLSPGEYVLQAAKSRPDSSTEGEFASGFVTMNGNDVTGVVLRMAAGSSIAGRITFESDETPPLEDFKLSPIVADPDLLSLADNPPARAELHDDGTFDMHGVSGPRRLLLVAAPPGWSLKSVRVNGGDVTDSPLLFGTPEQSLRDVDVVITNRAAEIGGRVTDGRGDPFSDAVVVAFATDRARWYPQSRYRGHTMPDAQGTFTLRALAPGDYLVAAVDRRSGVVENGDLDNPEFLEGLVASATKVTLGEGEHASPQLRLVAR